MKYIKPEIKKTAFHCPFCNVYSNQSWGDLMENVRTSGCGWRDMRKWMCALCDHCKQVSLWRDTDLIYPSCPNLPPPNEDLGVDIQNDYREAASIVDKCPRAAAALLRLGIQKLCKQLGEKGDNLNDDIAHLVKKGLNPQLQKALDFVRVIGNESVHPGQINITDNTDIAYKLFELVNMISQVLITDPKEIDKLYCSLPKEKLKAIEIRDGNTEHK